MDETRYHVRLSWSDGGHLEEVDRGFRLRSGGAAWIDVECAFGQKILPKVLPGFLATVQASAEHWQGFWTSGGVIDLAGSTDLRALELERRIVLSQYLLAVQSAGSLPPPEAGLMDIDPWSGQFHMEMVWWHMAHYALWNRWELADRAVHGFYERARPRAEALARQLGYQGMMWPKMTGPEGRNSVGKGVYLRAAAWPDTYTRLNWEHPDPAGVVGMLPPGEGVDVEVARRTLWKVHDTWKWSSVWGWDFLWVAMAAARLGEPQLAIDMLLKKAGTKNRYDARGVCIGGPCRYLPGNGGLLYAVAMMAAGWDGAPARHAPGFPDNGLWNVRWEGLKPAL